MMAPIAKMTFLSSILIQINGQKYYQLTIHHLHLVIDILLLWTIAKFIYLVVTMVLIELMTSIDIILKQGNGLSKKLVIQRLAQVQDILIVQ